MSYAYPGSKVLLPSGGELLPDLLVSDATTLRVALRWLVYTDRQNRCQAKIRPLEARLDWDQTVN